MRTLRSDLIDPTISVHHGRIVKRTGDGSIIEFKSVVDAVRCALEVQTGMVERNAGLPPERRIEFRVGVHLGDVVEEADGDLMGDGVNVAARLEGICEPGGICLSEDAYRQVKSRLELQVADLGPQSLKNIAEPVRAFLLRQGAPATQKSPQAGARTRGVLHRWPALAAALALLLLAAGAFAWRTGYAPRFIAASVDDKLANAPRLSIVVLPFENLSGDKEQDYFADAITDDLTTDLSHIAASFVIARDTAFTYKGKAIDARQIGKELSVRYILEGSVRRVGEQITVNAQLISTDTGAHVWADRLDGERSRLSELQVEFVARLASTLGVELIKAEGLRSIREHTKNPDAADLAMRGWVVYYLRPLTPATRAEAIDDFERALRIDPQQEEALIGLSKVLTVNVQSGWSAHPAEDADRAEALASHALSAEPENALAHDAKARTLFAKKQYDAGIAEEEAAIAFDPNLATANAAAGFFKVFVGHAAEGFSGLEKALLLSPRGDHQWAWEWWICKLHAHLAQWDQAIERCRKSIALSPTEFAYPYLAAAYAWTGRDADARAAVAELLKLEPGSTVQQWADSVRKSSDDPTYQRELQPIVEGLRKAGLPEGEQRTN